MSSVKHLGGCILEDLRGLVPDIYKSPLKKLSTMVAGLIHAQSCNTSALSASLPIETDRPDSRYAWIERFLSTHTIDDMQVMEALARPILTASAANGQVVVVCLDQTSIGDDRAIAMLSVRVGERALPLFWRVKATKGNIPVGDYIPLLQRLKNSLPDGIKAMVMADRFFGTPELVKACQEHGFSYRIRLKGNLTLLHNAGEIKVEEMPKLGLASLKEACLCGTDVTTNIGYLHEKGHPEPWFIAMDAEPTRTAILDYGLRWGIESMFSDYKTRGFGLEDTHLQRTDRISRMLLVIAIAIYWATINGRKLQKKPRKKAA